MTAKLGDAPNQLEPGPHGRYGYQGGAASFDAGTTPGGAGLLEQAAPSLFLWDVSVDGSNVLIDLSWGTKQTRQILGLRPPLRAQLAGAVSVQVRQRDAGQPGSARGSLTAATAPCESIVRSVQGTGALPASASSVVALGAATVEVDGLPVVLASGQRLAVVELSEVTAGSVLVEHSV